MASHFERFSMVFSKLSHCWPVYYASCDASCAFGIGSACCPEGFDLICLVISPQFSFSSYLLSATFRSSSFNFKNVCKVHCGVLEHTGYKVEGHFVKSFGDGDAVIKGIALLMKKTSSAPYLCRSLLIWSKRRKVSRLKWTSSRM